MRFSELGVGTMGGMRFGKWKVGDCPLQREKARQVWATGEKGAKQEAGEQLGVGLGRRKCGDSWAHSRGQTTGGYPEPNLQIPGPCGVIF